MIFGRRQEQRPEPEPVGDPYAAHADRFDAFLDQARWLLEQQQARGAAFQQSAVALVGFDGVLLALLIGGDALGGVTARSGAWWTGLAGALLVTLSAFAGLQAIVPWSTYAVATRDTLNAWADLQSKASWNTSKYHFAHMLLALDPPVQGATSLPTRFGRWWRKLLRRPQPTTQVLLAAERLATRRGRWTTTSALLLVGGITALLLVFFNTAGSESNPTPSPTATETTT